MPEHTTSCKRDEEKKNGLSLDNIIIIIIVIIVIVIVVKALTNNGTAGAPATPKPLQFIGETFTAGNEYSSIFDLGATPVA